MSEGYTTVGGLLELLTGHGVYDVAIIEEQFTQFGFTYDRATDTLSYEGRSVRLGSATPTQVQKSMANDPKGGILDTGLGPTTRLVDALVLSAAVFQLVAPGKVVPSSLYNGRGTGFRKNVQAIRAIEEATRNPFVN